MSAHAHTPSGVLDGYMTQAELAKELGRSLKTLTRWRTMKKGPPFIRMGPDILYPREGVKRWLEGLARKQF